MCLMCNLHNNYIHTQVTLQNSYLYHIYIGVVQIVVQINLFKFITCVCMHYTYMRKKLRVYIRQNAYVCLKFQLHTSTYMYLYIISNEYK